MTDQEEIAASVARFCNTTQGALDHAHTAIEGALVALAEAIRTQTAQQEKDREELGRLKKAAQGVEHAWERLCECVDEFEPEDMTACCENRDMLDDAILRLIAALRAAALAGREGEK